MKIKKSAELVLKKDLQGMGDTFQTGTRIKVTHIDRTARTFHIIRVGELVTEEWATHFVLGFGEAEEYLIPTAS